MTTDIINKPIDKDIPYWWQSVKDNMLLCYGCRLHCHKDKERWTSWKLPARTIKAWGSAIHFEEGCNIKRVGMLRDIANLQKRQSPPHLKFAEQVTKWFDVPQPQTYYAGQFEPTIDILVDGELKTSINGNYKQGMIADAIKPYVKTVRAGKKTLTILKGGYVADCGGGVHIAVNGKVINGEYQYFKEG